MIYIRMVRVNKHRLTLSWLTLTRTSHRPSAAAVDPGMHTALRFLGLLDILSSMPVGPFVARLVSTPVCTASRRNTVRNAGWAEQ